MKQNDLRQALRNKRKSLTPRQQQKSAKHLLYQCQKQGIFTLAHHIALYLPFDGEIQTHYLIDFLQQQNKQVYLPVLDKTQLLFVKNKGLYSTNKFKIIEPTTRIYQYVKKLNLILMPLVGFDKYGNRLGMGGGYYDKTLSFKRQQTQFNPPTLIGLAHKCQQVEVFKSQLWDIKPKHIIVA